MWVHGRGHDERQKTLAERHVVIAGCGSVGAPIAQQLAMAGVGRLTIVDPENLSWSNIGRHPLGSKFIGLPKASTLSRLLQESLPHLRIDGLVGKIEDFLASGTDFRADLIVVATADWSCERVLNLGHIDGQITCPLLFTWTEPHACAGHAVYLPQARPCLQCGLTLGGDMRHPVTRWPADMPSHLSEPACGAYFQPYGPIELMGTIAAAASLALDALLNKLESAAHRAWAGSRSLLEEHGGAWSDAWIAGHSNRNEGALQENLIWQQDPDCNACGQRRAASLSTSASPDSSS
jgi:glycine/D-amino acid oxidase-like deaminating enzyme